MAKPLVSVALMVALLASCAAPKPETAYVEAPVATAP